MRPGDVPAPGEGSRDRSVPGVAGALAGPRPTTAQALQEAGLDVDALLALLRAAVAEDLGEAGDVTSLATVPPDTTMRARFVARSAGVVAGLPVLACLFEDFLGPEAEVETLLPDGTRVAAGQALASLAAPARGVLALERTALNLLAHLCGVATLTRGWVDAVAGTGVGVRDTRKTMPLLRAVDKYAVRCGGGLNHRAGLYDAVLVKDNHVAAAGGVGAAVDAAYAVHPRGTVVVQVEVDTLDQLDEALEHGADQVLLDNFDLERLRTAVARVREVSPGTVLEASGGLTLASARAVAETGVDLVAVGALTHSAPALDIGLDVLTGS